MDYKVSVIVPVYNAENYLHQCVNSLLKQTLKSIQVILVDDGSKDSSGEIIDSYAKDYDNIESYHKENGGSSTARNLGITKAKGEYISFLDSDDWLENDTFQVLYQIACDNDKVDIIQFRSFEEKDDSYYIPRSGYYNYERMKDELYPHLMPSFTEQGKPTYVRWSNCLRLYKSSLIKYNGVQYRRQVFTMEDYLFNFESTMVARSYYYYGEKPLYHVVKNPMSKSRNYRPALLDSCDFFLQEIRENSFYLENSRSFTYKKSLLYFADACIANEMSLKSVVTNIIRVRKVFNSQMCKMLRKTDDLDVVGWYQKVLKLIKKNSAIYLVYRYKVRKKLKTIYGKTKKS